MVKNALSLFIITVIIVVVFLPSYSKMQELKQKNVEFAQRIKALELKNIKLEREGRFLKNNPEYLEKVAREKMGLIRQGETVYKIVPEVKK
jgi:cell division protein FtsB